MVISLPSKKNHTSRGTGWPDFATVVNHTYLSVESLLETSCVSSTAMKANVVSRNALEPLHRRTPNHDSLGAKAARLRQAGTARGADGVSRTGVAGADRIQRPGLAVRVRRRPREEEGVGRHLPGFRHAVPGF